jgi:hypothetical protein
LLERLSGDVPGPAAELGVITQLRKSYPADLIATALTQARLRVRAQAKFRNAPRMYFTRIGLEQASSDRMAAHHAARFESFDSMFDLCTGIGGDLIGLAAGRPVIAVDIDPVHIRLASLNARANNVAGDVLAACADVRNVRLPAASAVFVDPARRSADRRFRAGETEPPLEWCFDLAEQVRAVGIKAGPTLATDLVPPGWEVEFVSERHDLKEAVLWSPALAAAPRRATLLPSGETLVQAPRTAIPIRSPGAYLLDPDPAVTRAGLVEELGRSLGSCWKIDSRIAFLSSDADLRTPFARTLAIEASMPWSLARLREQLRALDVGTADIRKRGSAVDVEDLQRRLRLTGSRSATIVLTRVSDRPWAFICTDPASPVAMEPAD